ncbi:MAG: 4Fe-4S dicluster domain-containing protein [Treponema sp.]|nr:4Fe-4S dicluster domain-containing protein [Treponema sp.]
MKKIAKDNWTKLYTVISASYPLYLPVRKGGQLNYAPWEEGCEADIETLKTLKSPKTFFLPQVENIYTASLEGKKIKIETQPFIDKQFVLFGVKGCDVKGVEVLDSVFLSHPVDKFYQARREHGTIVSLACSDPRATCFCKPFGIDASKPAGDVVTWISPDGWLYWNAQTEKGQKLTDFLLSAGLFEDADEADVQKMEKEIQEKINALPYSSGLPLDVFSTEHLLDFFNSPEWDSLHHACKACGTCTFICPTCQCYDIKDFSAGKSVIHYRCWDSCMYSDFTLMAHGNPRKTQKERFRQRFMHKLVYHQEKHKGEFSCVGCGRCVNQCPSSLNIVKVIKSLGGSANV